MDTHRIHFLCPDLAHPSGGVRMIYRQVDVLNRAGFSAIVVHQRPGFRADWFENRTPIAYAPVDIHARDILVFPEIEGPAIASAAPGVRKVIFNQNPYDTFGGYRLEDTQFQSPYTHSDVIATIVVSEDSRAYLQYAFPAARLLRIHLGIDPAVYYPSSSKRKQICFMPRKRPEDAQQIVSILRARDALRGFEIVPIHNKTEAEAAEIMRQSLVFFGFGHPEGCSLPPLEAMACGCVVIGYHGNGGREFLTPQRGFPIEAGDITGFAKVAEHALQRLDDDASAFAEMTRGASEHIQWTYSPEREREEILNSWRQLLE